MNLFCRVDKRVKMAARRFFTGVFGEVWFLFMHEWYALGRE